MYVIFCKTRKSAMTLFSMRNLVPARKQENYNPERKTVKELEIPRKLMYWKILEINLSKSTY